MANRWKKKLYVFLTVVLITVAMLACTTAGHLGVDREGCGYSDVDVCDLATHVAQ